MAIALIVSSFLTVLAVAAVVVSGFLVRAGMSTVTMHVYVATPIIVFAMLTHTMTIFYFIGTGKEIKDRVRERSLDEAYVRESRRFKGLVFPPAALSLGLLIAAFVVGGGVDVGAIPWPVHMILALLALALSVIAALRAARMIYRNVILVERLTEDLAGPSKAGDHADPAPLCL